jgi:hypothetical protein
LQAWTYNGSKESDRPAARDPTAQLRGPGTQGAGSKQDEEQGADRSAHNGEVPRPGVGPILQQ